MMASTDYKLRLNQLMDNMFTEGISNAPLQLLNKLSCQIWEKKLTICYQMALLNPLWSFV